MSQRQKAIIVDIDGTLANHQWRHHHYYDPSKTWDDINGMSMYDMPHIWCQELVFAFAARGYHIVFLTARNDTSKDVTEAWLLANVGPTVDYSLIMRPSTDKTDDWVYKLNAYKQHIVSKYEVLFAIDDKPSVITMWRDIGIECLACTPEH